MGKSFILAPDSFKGTLSAQEVCEIEKQVILQLMPDARVKCIPMSDGGEGMVSAYHRILGGKLMTARVCGPLGEPVDAAYLMLDDGTAILEMSAAAGLPMVLGRENPLETVTVGVGEMLLDAKQQGARKILLGIGGSCTNDCAIGMGYALGYRYFDAEDRLVEPYAKNLGQIFRITPPAEDFGIPVKVACDVNNPLLGPIGATRTFGPQKGATKEMVEFLEAGMESFAKVLADFSKKPDLANLPGAGAAGGMGAASVAFLNAQLLPGAELLLQTAGFADALNTADYVITGEGRIDWQSAGGKVVGTIGKHCRKAGIPCIALCGSLGPRTEELRDCGITAVYAATPGTTDFEIIKKNATANLKQLTEDTMKKLLE